MFTSSPRCFRRRKTKMQMLHRFMVEDGGETVRAQMITWSERKKQMRLRVKSFRVSLNQTLKGLRVRWRQTNRQTRERRERLKWNSMKQLFLFLHSGSWNVTMLFLAFADAFVLTWFTVEEAVLLWPSCFTAYYIVSMQSCRARRRNYSDLRFWNMLRITLQDLIKLVLL